MKKYFHYLKERITGPHTVNSDTTIITAPRAIRKPALRQLSKFVDDRIRMTEFEGNSLKSMVTRPAWIRIEPDPSLKIGQTDPGLNLTSNSFTLRVHPGILRRHKNILDFSAPIIQEITAGAAVIAVHQAEQRHGLALMTNQRKLDLYRAMIDNTSDVLHEIASRNNFPVTTIKGSNIIGIEEE